jgi:hypothetical protein
MLVSSMHGQLANHTPTVQLREREREGDPQQQTADTVPSKKDCRHRVIAAFQPFCLAQH